MPQTADNANDIEEEPQAEPRCHWRCQRIGYRRIIVIAHRQNHTRCPGTEYVGRFVSQGKHTAARHHMKYGSSGVSAVIKISIITLQ